MKLLISIFMVIVLVLWDLLWLPGITRRYAVWASNITRLLTWMCGVSMVAWLCLNLVALGEPAPPATRLHVGFIFFGAGLGLLYGLVEVFIKPWTKTNARR